MITTEYAEAIAELFGAGGVDTERVECIKGDMEDLGAEAVLADFEAASRFMEGVACDPAALSPALALALGDANLRLREAAGIARAAL